MVLTPARMVLVSLVLGIVWPGSLAAQTLGTFHWKMEPYCNTLTLTVVQEGAGFRLQGTENLCDSVYLPQPVQGTAVVDSSGTAIVGLTTTVPGGFSLEGIRVLARIDPATLNGSWSDNAGRYGTLLRVASPSSTVGLQRGGVSNTFLHIVSAENRPAGATNVSCFSHPLTNGRPGALMLFSANRGSQTEIRPLVASPVSLYFDDDLTGLGGELANNVWCLSRNDSQPMPIGAGFTVRVAPR